MVVWWGEIPNSGTWLQHKGLKVGVFGEFAQQDPAPAGFRDAAECVAIYDDFIQTLFLFQDFRFFVLHLSRVVCVQAGRALV